MNRKCDKCNRALPIDEGLFCKNGHLICEKCLESEHGDHHSFIDGDWWLRKDFCFMCTKEDK